MNHSYISVSPVTDKHVIFKNWVPNLVDQNPLENFFNTISFAPTQKIRVPQVSGDV